MNLYRFSPINSKEELLEAIRHTHLECHKLCKQSLGKYLPAAGNVGIFCHYDKEYEYLTDLNLNEGSRKKTSTSIEISILHPLCFSLKTKAIKTFGIY